MAFTKQRPCILRSTDAGVTFTDMTWDATTKPTPPGTCCQPNPIAPNGNASRLSTQSSELPGSNGALLRRRWWSDALKGNYSRTSRRSAPARGLSGTRSGNLPAVALGSSSTALYNLQQGALDSAVPELSRSLPIKRQASAGRYAGQRNI